MTTPADTTARVRGAFVGAAAGAVTVAAHGVGAGMMPSQSAFAMLAVVCAGAGATVASLDARRLPTLSLVLVLGAAQAAGHGVLGVVDAHHHGSLWSGKMLALHLVAVVVCAVLIRGAEAAVRVALSTLRRVLPRLLAPLVVDDAVASEPILYRPSVVLRLLASSGPGTRGPPVTA